MDEGRLLLRPATIDVAGLLALVRDQYGQAFAPGYNISSGFSNPDQPVDDLRAMTYTAYLDTADAEEKYTDQAPLDERLAGSGTPLLAIFGAEDPASMVREMKRSG